MMKWKKGRGKLGLLAPLPGRWVARADSQRGPLECIRTFESVLDGHYIRLTAEWTFATSAYTEMAMMGMRDGVLSYWSFTSDGKRSEACLADGTDIHPDAICFEARMPAGLARMLYWPHPEAGFLFAVESRNKKGWNRFLEHHYLPVAP